MRIAMMIARMIAMIIDRARKYGIVRPIRGAAYECG